MANQENNMSDISRILALAGRPQPQTLNESNDYGDNITSRKGHEYDVATSAEDSRPKLRQTNNYADNALVEQGENLDYDKIEDIYYQNRRGFDHEGAVAATADELGIRGEDVEHAISYERFSSKVGVGKKLSDYTAQPQMQEADLAEDDLDEAPGRQDRWAKTQARHARYDHVFALLPTEQNANLDDLEHNEYFGADLAAGKSGVVVMRILVGYDASGEKWRYTYASSYGDVSSYKPSKNILTYHDRTQKERPGELLFAFNGDTYMDPNGRAQIAQKLQSVGMNPKRKYSIRVFK